MMTKADSYADFHALMGITFNTWLQTNGVPPRMAQELMRHSPTARLTDQVYLDTSLLPLQECYAVDRQVYGGGLRYGLRFPAKPVIWSLGLAKRVRRMKIRRKPFMNGF